MQCRYKHRSLKSLKLAHLCLWNCYYKSGEKYKSWNNKFWIKSNHLLRKSNICKCREGGKLQIFGAKFKKFLDLIKIGQNLIFFLFVFAEKNVGSVLSSWQFSSHQCVLYSGIVCRFSLQFSKWKFCQFWMGPDLLRK